MLNLLLETILRLTTSLIVAGFGTLLFNGQLGLAAKFIVVGVLGILAFAAAVTFAQSVVRRLGSPSRVKSAKATETSREVENNDQ